MSHKRLAVNNIAEGADLDSVAYADEYRCDGCHKIFAPGDLFRVQGQIYGPAASSGGFINADICRNCTVAKPIRTFFQGIVDHVPA